MCWESSIGSKGDWLLNSCGLTIDEVVYGEHEDRSKYDTECCTFAMEQRLVGRTNKSSEIYKETNVRQGEFRPAPKENFPDVYAVIKEITKSAGEPDFDHSGTLFRPHKIIR